MVLGYSRALAALFTLDQTLESFLRGHVDAFDALGGAARNLVYDNLRSAVLDRRGTAVQFHPRLLELAGHYHFAPRPCTPGRGNENAMAESFFATLECELLDRTSLSTHVEARATVFEFIEGWYNTRRRHSALGYVSPLEFERLHAGPVDGARPVDALRAPTSPLDPALRTGSTPPTGNDVDVHIMT